MPAETMKRIVFILIISCIVIETSFANKTDTSKIQVNSEGFLLDGIILRNSSHKGKLPVIIFLVGSGGNSSYTSNYKDFTRFFFEQTFLNNGFALVYFDKRGVGKSKGNWFKTTFEDRATDAKNVALAIQHFDFVDHKNIYVIGHSQGGWIAQVALAAYPEIFAGGISMAGPAFGVKKQLINDYQSRFICKKGLDENNAFIKASKKVKRDLLFISLFGIKGNLKQMKLIKNFEAAPYLKQINKPFLMLLGENDALVNVNWCMEELTRIFPRGLPRNMEIYHAKGETHSFKTASKCYVKGDEIFYSDTTRQYFFEWIKTQISLSTF